MKTTRFQRILAVMLSALLLLTVAPVAVFADEAIEYVDAQGEAQTPITEYTVLEASVRNWSNGWYVLNSDVVFGDRIAVQGDNVNLLLCDGATLNANKGIFIREGYSLTIWAQKNGTGALIAKGNTQGSYESAGIGASPECGGHWIDSYTYDNYDAGDLTVNGGVIIATGAWHCAGIGSSVGRNYGTITINGGTVTATGGEGAAGIGGAYSTSGNVIVINGGTVTATGGDHGAGIGGGENFGGDTITINGGNVTAVGGYYGAGIGGGRKGGSGEITVGGGTIQAQGGKYGAGIGNGNSGEYGHITFNGGIVNASSVEGIVAAGIGGKRCYIRFNYTEPGYDMRITTDSNYEGHAALFDKPFISVGLSKTRTYNGYTPTGTISDTIIPKTAGIWDVTFDKNGGTGSMQSEEVPGGTYTLPACIFTAPSAEEPFICWAVKVGDADPVVKQPGDTVLVTADTTVKAIWKTEHTVSFENGGGSGTMDSAAINAYDTYTLPENGFTAPAGKHFFAWEISAGDSSANIMQPGEELLVTGNVTARALWTVSITSWAELQTAIDNAQDGDTVALGQSLTAQSNDLRLLVSGKSITFDLNGYTLDRAQNAASLLGGVFTVASGATLTVCDSGAGGTGTITGGYAEKGGAFYNEGTLIIDGGAITDNHVSNENNENRGGAIYNNGALIIKNCTISGNDGDDGGAIFNTENGSAVLKNVTMTNNTSVNHGGGAIVNYGALTLQGCTVAGNTAKSNGGAIWTNAGDKAVTITNTTITNNATSNDDTRGGAIYIESGSVAVTGGKIADNTAKDGGAVFNNASGTLNLTDVFVHSNKSTQRGGGSITNYGTATLTDCDVWDNEAKTNGGAIWTGGAQADVTLTNCVVTGNTAELTGGGICLYQGTLTASGTTVSNNQSAGGAGMYIHENGTAILGGDGNLFYWNESSANGGGIANKGNLQIASLFNAQANSATGYGGGVWNDGSMSVKDTVIIWENNSDLFGKDVYLPEGKVVTLNGELNFSTIGVDAEEPDQFITSGWYAWQRNASPESVFKAPEYHAVYLPDGATELKLKKTDDYPYNAEATVWAETSDRSTYQVGVDYTIRNLTSGNSRRFDGSLVSLYGTYDGITRYTRQGASSSGVAGSSVAALEIDRSKLDTIQETGVCMEFTPFFYTTGGKFRCGVELFPYSLDPPPHLGDVNNNVGENAYNTITLTGSKNGSYTYQLRYGSADGALRCAATCDGDFSADAAAQAGTETQTWGPYRWYLTGDAPAPGESVKLRIAAICCAAGFKMESLQVTTPMYMLSEWTDVTVTGTCSHSNGHLQAVAANEPTCTLSGNSAYWKCDVCGKCFSDAAAENEIVEDSTVIPATGHTYAEPSAEDWRWTKSGDTYTADVTVVCEICENEQMLTAAVEKTAAADGTAIYTATATAGEQTFTAVMPTVYHSVTGYEDAAGNTVAADKATAAEGQTVTLTVTCAEGYGMKSLTVPGVEITSVTDCTYTFVMPDGDVTVAAEFDLDYTVSVVSNVPGAVTVDKPNAFEGDTVTLTVDPGTNYALDTLTVTDADGEEIEVNDNTFVMPAGNVTVTARFYEVTQLYVGGIQVTEKNKADILGDGTAVYEGSYAEGTLTLTNATITAGRNANIEMATTDAALTIVLSGENTLSGKYYGVQFFGSGLTITGGGTLNATGSNNAIFSDHALTLDGVSVNATGTGGNGIDCSIGSLTIRNSTVTSEGHYKGVNSRGDLAIENSNVRSVTDRMFDGLYTEGALTIADSTVYAKGGTQGISVPNASLTISGNSNVTAETSSSGYSAAIAKNFVFGEGLAVAEPLGGSIKAGDNCAYVYNADGTFANRFVVGAGYAVNITENALGTVTADKPYACAGDTVTLTVTPGENSVFESLSVTDADGEEIEVTDNKFTMPAKDVTVTSRFYETYKIWIGGVQVTEKNKADVFGDGSVAYDGTQNEGTLTLDGVVVTGYYEDYAKRNIYIFNNDLTLTILLCGENTVGDGSADYGVDLYCAGVTFTGDGSLSINAATEALYTHSCPVLIDGTTLTVRAGSLFGMEINSGDLTIRSSEIFAESNNYMAIDGDRVEITNSSVTAVSNNSSSYALFGSKGVSIINSSVVANSPRGDGIRSGYDGDLIITGSTVTATSEEYSGLAGYRGCTITDSVVEATGKYQGVCFSGAFTVEGDSKVTISNLKPGYAAVLTGSLNIGEGLAISTPQNAVINDYQGSQLVYKTVREADGTTLADKVVVEAGYAVHITENALGTVTADKPYACAGDTVTLTVTPGENSVFESLSVTDADGEEIEVTDNTFTMPAKDVTVTSRFYETYKIRVGGVQVTSKNKADVLGDGSVVYEGDQTEGTLYLTDANITGAYYEGGIAKNIFVNNADLSLTITLSGENSVSGGHYAFDIACAGVTLTGEGLLNAHASSEAFYFHRTPLTIDTTTVNAEADNSFCMEIGSAALTIRDSSVTAVGGGNMALDAKDVTIVNSTVDATAGYSYAIYGSNSIRITDSTVTATSQSQYAVYAAYEDMTITGSSVTASSEGSCGIYVNRSLAVTDSTVETTGWYQGLEVKGALTLEGDTGLTVNGRNHGYAAVLVGSLEMDDDFVITTPENAVVANYYGDALDAVWEADGTTLADNVVIRRAYHVSVNDADHGTVSADKSTAFAGDTVTLTITPDIDYTLASLTVTTVSGESVAVTDGAFVMPKENVVITAAFACPHASYTLTGWSWTDGYSGASATFVCGTCGDERTVPASIETFEVSPADCENDRVVKYVATVEFGGGTYTDTKENVTLAGTATGHTYGEPVWSWTADHSGVTATFTCACGDEQNVPGTVTEVEVSAATATADKVVKYTASLTFNGKTYTTETGDVTLPGTATGEPDTPPTEPTDPDTPTGSNICKWDNVDHGTSFWGRLVKFFHSILYFFAHLFGRR